MLAPIIVLVLALAGRAATYTDTYSIDANPAVTYTPWTHPSELTGDGIPDPALEYFNTSLGTLTKVTFTFSTTLYAFGFVDNEDASSASGSTSWDGTVSVTGLPAGTVNNLSPQITFSYNLAADEANGDDEDSFGDEPNPNWLGDDSAEVGSESSPLSASASTSLIFVTGDAGLDAFKGTGSFGPTIDMDAAFAGEGSFLNANVTTYGSVSLTVEYEYTVVPEPGEIALWAGLGLVGFAGYRRCRKA